MGLHTKTVRFKWQHLIDVAEEIPEGRAEKRSCVTVWGQIIEKTGKTLFPTQETSI